MDALLIFDPILGSGQSASSKKTHGNNKLFRVAPFVVLKDVQTIAAAIQSGRSDNSKSYQVDMDAIRTAGEAVKQREEEELRQLEIESNTPEDWLQIEEHNKSVIQNKDDIIANHEAQIRALQRDLQTRNDEYKRISDLYEKHQRRRSRVQSSVNDDELNEVRWQALHGIQKMIAKDGGLSRLTMFNNHWHKMHLTAAKQLWGYHNWEETKHYVGAYFPELDTSYDPSEHIQQLTNDGADFKLPNLTAFEKCLLVRMFFHKFSHQQVISLLVNRDRTTIGDYVKEWVPRWANVGIDLSLLDISKDYLYKEAPARSIDLNKFMLVFVDGKDYLCGTKRSDTTIEKCQYSSKTEKSAARDLTFSTGAGLIFEFSPRFGGRAGERAIVEFMVSLGPKNAPISEWKDIAKNDPWTKKDDTFGQF
eukprot:CCRYP_020605-RA/>CCRYP_020605-RA protein AED:0.30 eAED:0.30 QI:0/-1/0/1/-1/1/1/0/419